MGFSIPLLQWLRDSWLEIVSRTMTVERELKLNKSKSKQLKHKNNCITPINLYFKIAILQVLIRRVRVISTVWSVTITVQTQTRWWLIEDNIRSWTVFWLLASRSSLQLSSAPPRAAVTMGSRLITTAESVTMQCWDCRRWKLINIVIWMSSALNTQSCNRRLRVTCRLMCPGVVQTAVTTKCDIKTCNFQ